MGQKWQYYGLFLNKEAKIQLFTMVVANFWCSKCTNGIIYLADGTWLTEEQFNETFSKKLFDIDWEKLPNPERSVG